MSGRSELAKAIRYAPSRWTALTRYLDDGMLEISNNAAERGKFYAGGERAAIPDALIEPPSSTASIQKPICARWSAVSPSSCQRAAESPHFGACNFPHLAGTAISRLSDQDLRFLAVDRDA